MIKKISFLLLACFILCGCSNGFEFETSSSDILSQTGENVKDDKNDTSVSELSDEVDTSDYVTLKIGLPSSQNTSKQISLFNQKIHENGCKINVEAVDYSQYYEYGNHLDTAEAIKKCEEKNGPLDIIFFMEYFGTKGTIYKLVSNGYLEPLDYKNTALYGLVPDKLWETAKVGGKVYTFPAWRIINGDYIYFNKNYVSEEVINSFDGTTEKLIDIASKIQKEDNLRRIEFSLIGYRDCSIGLCDKYDIQEGLVLDYETMMAYNPFEYEPFIQELCRQNLMYEFSDGYFEKNDDEKIKVKESAIAVTHANLSEDEIEAQNLSAYCISPAGYLTNLLNTGITAKSTHKEEALQLLNEMASGDYAEFDDLNTSLTCPKYVLEELKKSEIAISPFAGFVIYYKDVEEFEDIEQKCYGFYEELISASDFDGKLLEIQQKLKDMGIDDYVNKVNEILSENGVR